VKTAQKMWTVQVEYRKGHWLDQGDYVSREDAEARKKELEASSTKPYQRRITPCVPQPWERA